MSSGRWLASELVQATDRIEAALEGPWSLSAMAEVAGYSPFHFHRAFRDEVGETPTAFVERLRLERAALLLLASETPITHLAWDVGFRNPETFARRFRKRFGVSARGYRKHQLDLWERMGLEAGMDPIDGPEPIRIEALPEIRVRVRRRIGEDEAFDLADGGVGITLDWPGITDPGRVRQDEGHISANGDTSTNGEPGAAGVLRVVGDGLFASLAVPADGSVPASVYQRLFVWAMGGRHRLRPGAILELEQEGRVHVYLPVRDTKEE